MKIMNIGILAHVDAGKTTLTESMLYASGTIAESGRVDRGSTITDSMALEKQRGITIQASIASYQWSHFKINLIDTPGHIDFYSEVERSLNVLDGAILLISAKDGIQAQTRILFDAIRKRKLPALIFIIRKQHRSDDRPGEYQYHHDGQNSQPGHRPRRRRCGRRSCICHYEIPSAAFSK